MQIISAGFAGAVIGEGFGKDIFFTFGLSKPYLKFQNETFKRHLLPHVQEGLGVWVLDGAVASENILIAANALGPGAVWTAIYPFRTVFSRYKRKIPWGPD